MQKVLIIDDNPDVCSALHVLLSLQGIDTLLATSPGEGIGILEKSDDIGLVIQDMNFSCDTTSGEEGEQLFAQIRDRYPDMPVIIITAWTQLEAAVRLVQTGAADYIAKPWDDKKLIASVMNLLELGELQDQQLTAAKSIHDARRELQQRADLCGIVYESSIMQRLLDVASRVAASDIPVLITGPNGSGKEKIAEVIQVNSRVKDGPFVIVNLGALPSELMEAELFGAEAGAYTGLVRRRVGRFEAADGGTLFLDELGNLSLSGQMKLLRVLETGKFERLGSNTTLTVKVRVISATNADLKTEIAQGRFREDLYYRLNVIELQVPALRERSDDVLPLLNHFVGEGRSVEPAAVRALQKYSWPGNVRELENSVQRAKLLCDLSVLPLSAFAIEMDEGNSAVKKHAEPSKQEIESVLHECKWVIAQAAKQLGFSRQALYRRMEKYSIQVERGEQ